ncbi:MAG: iron-containing redox enzyme family protein [Bdellovibrio sp.]|nr:iron-containing redox enzyme family protein [Bdellovibrio sp.]
MEFYQQPTQNEINALAEKTQSVFKTESQKMINAFINFPWENEEAYSHWLAQSYYLVRHTTTYLCLTAGGMSFHQPEHHSFLLHHLREETNHEMLAFRDQENMGWTIDQTPETFEAQMMSQSQYYFIDKTPFAHYGFFWLLEAMAAEAGPIALKRLMKTYGKGCVSFLELHATEDVEHSREIAAMVEKFPAHVLPYVIRNMEQTGRLYTEMLENIAKKVSSVNN